MVSFCELYFNSYSNNVLYSFAFGWIHILFFNSYKMNSVLGCFFSLVNLLNQARVADLYRFEDLIQTVLIVMQIMNLFSGTWYRWTLFDGFKLADDVFTRQLYRPWGHSGHDLPGWRLLATSRFSWFDGSLHSADGQKW